MKLFDNRLKKIEEELVPDEQFIVLYARHKHSESDVRRQQEEYYNIHGRNNKNIKFLILNDYTDDSDYNEFISRMRSGLCKDNTPNFSHSWWKVHKD